MFLAWNSRGPIPGPEQRDRYKLPNAQLAATIKSATVDPHTYRAYVKRSAT